MRVKDAIRQIAKKQKKSLSKVAIEMGLKPMVLIKRMNCKDIRMGTVIEIANALGYKVVAYRIDDKLGTKEDEYLIDYAKGGDTDELE